MSNFLGAFTPFIFSEAVVWRCSVKKVFIKLSQISQKNTCARISFLIKLQAQACNYIKKDTLGLVLSCEICEIYVFHRTPEVAATDFCKLTYLVIEI